MHMVDENGFIINIFKRNTKMRNSNGTGKNQKVINRRR